MKSKCCNSNLINIYGFTDYAEISKFQHFGKSILQYCGKCGLVYHKIEKKLKPEEELDEWE